MPLNTQGGKKKPLKNKKKGDKFEDVSAKQIMIIARIYVCIDKLCVLLHVNPNTTTLKTTLPPPPPPPPLFATQNRATTDILLFTLFIYYFLLFFALNRKTIRLSRPSSASRKRLLQLLPTVPSKRDQWANKRKSKHKLSILSLSPSLYFTHTHTHTREAYHT